MIRYFLFFCVLCTVSHAQVNVESDLIKAEYAFITMAREQNTRDAFLHFLSDSAVTFREGPRVGKQHLINQKPDSSLLSWKPTYSEMALSGDFGYNLGPWEYSSNRNDLQPVAYGHFITVWLKENNEWKALLDIGISHPKMDNDIAFDLNKLIHANTSNATLQQSNALQADKKLIASIIDGPQSAYGLIVSDDAKFFRNEKLPITDRELILNQISDEHKHSKIVYDQLGGFHSSSNDMAFTYGKAIVYSIGKQSSDKPQQLGYVRIWRKENGVWKLVVEVLS